MRACTSTCSHCENVSVYATNSMTWLERDEAGEGRRKKGMKLVVSVMAHMGSCIILP
jgi:hypothetical protein